ncbi:MAG: hypothetical protein ACRD5M_14435 [Candidatus Acidiferrales bacterium]
MVNGVFDLEVTSKIALCLIIAVGLLVMAPIVIYSLPKHTVTQWLWVVFACAYFSLALFIPRFIREIGLEQERSMKDFLWVTLEAGDDLSAFEPPSPPRQVP